ncbi:hypothetical protein [Bordetella petrii]|uniref:hypothetical protein n=1 Tax=Bordetella petrii TaxID=94624 RepID=UPI003733A74D
MSGIVMQIRPKPVTGDPSGSDNSVGPHFRPIDDLTPKTHHYASLEAFDAVELSEGRFSIAINEGHFECRLHLRPEHARLFIVFTSSHTAEAPLPAFQRVDQANSLPGSILYISDPTLFVDRSLTLGWYLGTSRHDWTQAIVQLAQRMIGKLGLSIEDVFTLGTAGAGFAALQVACGLGPATAIAINPHTDVRRYYASIVNTFLGACFSAGNTAQENTDMLDRRLSAIATLQGSAETKIVYVQNRNNPHVYQNHFLPFCQAFGLNPADETCRDDTMELVMYSGPAKTLQAPPGIFSAIISHAIALNNGESPDAIPSHSGTNTTPLLGAPVVRRDYIKKETPPPAMLQATWRDFDSIESYGKTRLKNGRFSVAVPSGNKFECLLLRKPAAKKLFVMLTGARNWKIRGPEFSRLTWHPALPGTALYVTDPAMTRKKLALAWYVGTQTENWIQSLAELIRTTCRKLHLKTRDVIVYGSSGGGFGALTLAAALGDATAVAVNPQTHVLNYHPRTVNNFLKVAFGVATPEELDAQTIDQRFSAIEAIKRAPNVKVLYLQSTGDKHHYEQHYQPFCAGLDLPLKGGQARGGLLETWTYVDRPGHRGEPEKLVPDILKRAVALSKL